MSTAESRPAALTVTGFKQLKAASEVGKRLADRAQTAGVKQIKVDRNGYRYHGRIRALADAAREGGLKF